MTKDYDSVQAHGGNYQDYDHITFMVGNAKQAASFYTTRFGFDHIAYRGLETGHRDIATHVIKLGKVISSFQSALNPENQTFTKELGTHSDSIKSIAFTVDDARSLYQLAMQRGARSIRAPWKETDDNGTVIMATVATFGDIEHTFIELTNYRGNFLPNYRETTTIDPLNQLLPKVEVDYIDHYVGNQPDHQMEFNCDYYEKCLGFHRFWTPRNYQIDTKYSAFRTVVMSDFHENIKMVITEPINSEMKSQVQEYLDYNGGPGIQHIGINTSNIINTVTNLRTRGLGFMNVPTKYYDNLKIRLKSSSIKVTEDLNLLQKLCILVDYDERGYLLQLFTKPLQDRPTFFLEFIQHNTHDGFGIGNVKALFEAIERDQEERGNL